MHIQYTATRSIQSAHTVSALVTDSMIDTACGVNWTCGTGWAISAGVADHTAGNTAKFYQTITFTSGYTYNVLFDVIGPAAGNAGTITPSIGGTSGSAIATPDNTTTNVVTTIVAGSSNSLLEFTPSSDFNGDLDNIYVSVTTQWDLYPGLRGLEQQFKTHIKRRRTEYGTTRTIRRGRDKLWIITTKNIPRATLESDYFEFFDSVSGGETFTIDPYRHTSGDSVDSPVTVIMEGDPNIRRTSMIDYFTVSFTVRVMS